MNPSERIDKHIAELADWRGQLVARLRTLILEADPDITEEWKWNTAVWSHQGLVCSVGAFKETVKMNLFQGALLEDPHKLFNAVDWLLRTSVRRFAASSSLLTCAGYLAHSFVKWIALSLSSSFVWQLSSFIDEEGQVDVAYLHAFSESHPLSQSRWQRESSFQALQKQHDGTQYAISSGNSTSLLKRSGHFSVLVV